MPKTQELCNLGGRWSGRSENCPVARWRFARSMPADRQDDSDWRWFTVAFDSGTTPASWKPCLQQADDLFNRPDAVRERRPQRGRHVQGGVRIWHERWPRASDPLILSDPQPPGVLRRAGITRESGT